MDNSENTIKQQPVVEGLPAESECPTVSVAPEEQPLSPDQIAKLKAEAAQAKENWDKLLRTAADFENYKKRVAREKQELTRYAIESLLERLIPVLDNFENALLSSGKVSPDGAQSLQTGIQMIYQQLKAVLSQAGLEEIDATNKPFDFNWHEALSQVERADLPEGQVVQQVRKGYKLRDRLLRPAAVVVSKKPGS